MKYLKGSLIILIGIIIVTLLTTFFSYFNIIGYNILKYFNLIIILILAFIGGIYIGKSSTNKGYLSGLKLSAIILVVLITLSYFLKENPFTIKGIIFYILNVIITTFGSIVGINKKEIE